MTTQEKIKVMQAFVDGKGIECRYKYHVDSNWSKVYTPDWNWEEFEYRIKKTEYVVITGTKFVGMQVVGKDQFTNNNSLWPLNEYKVVHEFEL